MKFTEFDGEKALDVFADLMEPAALIMADSEVADYAQSGNKIKAVKTAIKKHKNEVIEILAILNDEDPVAYKNKIKLFTLPIMLIELLNQPEVTNLFTLQGQMSQETPSGSAMESTGDEEH